VRRREDCRPTTASTGGSSERARLIYQRRSAP